MLNQAPTRNAVANIRNLMTKFEETLDCPFKTEDSPEYLSQLSCGHFASTTMWKKYKEEQVPQRVLCPQCREPTTEIGHHLPMTVINQFIQDIRTECNTLNELLERNQDAANMIAFSRPEFIVKTAEDDQSSLQSQTQTDDDTELTPKGEDLQQVQEAELGITEDDSNVVQDSVQQEVVTEAGHSNEDNFEPQIASITHLPPEKRVNPTEEYRIGGIEVMDDTELVELAT